MVRPEDNRDERGVIESLRRKIVLSGTVYTLVALLAISVIAILPLFLQLKRSEEEHLLRTARTRVLPVEEYLDRLRDVGRQIASRSAIREQLAAYLEGRVSRAELIAFTAPKLNDALRQFPEIVAIRRLGPEREELVAIGRALDLPLPIPCDDCREPVVSEPMLLDDDLLLAVGMPILAADDHRLGTDVIYLTTRELEGIVWDETGLRRRGNCLLARMAAGQAMIFFPGRLAERERYHFPADHRMYQKAVRRAERGESGILSYAAAGNGHQDSLAYAPVEGTTWALLVTMPQDELYASVYRLLLPVAGGVVLLTVLGGFGMLAMLRPLTRRTADYAGRLEELNRGLAREIVERQKAEAGVRRSEQEWRETFDAITDAVAIIDRQGRTVKMNRANQSFLNSLEPGSPRKERCQVHYGLEKTAEHCPFHRMLSSGRPEFGELHHAETDRYFHISVYPLRDAEGEVWGGVHIAQEVTEEKRLEKVKDEMLSSVSHEMRTPLTAMLGFVEFLLENEVEPEQQRDYLQTVLKETEKLNDLIGAFLDLQRMRAELTAYRFEGVSVPDLLRETAHLYGVASQAHRLSVACPEELPPVRGDQKRLRQVLKNLVVNAIKYSPRGGEVTLSAWREDSRVIIRVQDRGMGIPPHALNKIFDRFYRVDDSDRRIPGGIGLGLALVREVVRAHGGRVWVESTVGEGSSFFLALPVWQEEAVAAAGGEGGG